MKKIFTLLMGAVIALSASAAPLQFGKKHVSPAPNFATERVDAKKVVAFKSLKKEAEAEATVDTLSVVALEEQYYAAYGIYVYVLVAEDGTIFYFCFPSTGADPVVFGQAYAFSDMAADYCYYDYGGYGFYNIPFSDASFTKTEDAEGYVAIIATVDDEYGYSYYLIYDEASIPQAPEGGTFADLEVEGYVWEDSCQYVLSNDSLEFYFAFDVENLVSGQTYTESNMVARYTGIIFNEYTIINVSTLSFVKTDGENGAYSIAATIVDENGHTWNVSGSYVPEISDMTFAFSSDESTGITVTPSNNDDAWDWIVVSDAIFGQYGADEIASSIYQKYGDFYAVKGAQVLSWDEDLADYLEVSGNYVLVVWGAGEKNVTTPAAHYEFTVTIPEGIEDVAAEGKAVKVLRDGQLIIIKNGVKFNAQGAIIK